MMSEDIANITTSRPTLIKCTVVIQPISERQLIELQNLLLGYADIKISDLDNRRALELSLPQDTIDRLFIADGCIRLTPCPQEPTT